MNSSRKRWTKAEKWLLLAPVLVGIGAAIMTVAPGIIRKKLGRPIILATSAKDSLSGIALSRNGRILVASEQLYGSRTSSFNTVYVWDATTLKPLTPVTRPVLRTARRTDDATLCVAASPDGTNVAYGTLSGTSAVFERGTQKVLWTKPGIVHDLDFSANGKWLALNYNNFPIRSTYLVVNANTGRLVKEWQVLPDVGGTTLAFSPDNHFLASVGPRPKWNDWTRTPNEVGEIELRSTDTWKIVRKLYLPNTNSIAFSPDGKSLVATASVYAIPFNANHDGSIIRCFDVATGRVQWEKNTHDPDTYKELGTIIDACYSRDNRTIAILGQYRSVQVNLVNGRTGKVQRTLSASTIHPTFSALPHGLAFSPDGKRLFARDSHGVLVWDLD